MGWGRGCSHACADRANPGFHSEAQQLNVLDSQADLDYFASRRKPLPQVQWGAIEERRFDVSELAQHVDTRCHSAPMPHKQKTPRGFIPRGYVDANPLVMLRGC